MCSQPIQDGIDLVRFILETTIGYHRFCLGAQVVGGPIDIAAITKHEQFKWVRRKFFYSSTLNPPYDTHRSEVSHAETIADRRGDATPQGG